MSDLRTIMERGVGGAAPPPDGFERMLRRRERKQRRQRVAAGVVGIAFFVAAIWIVSAEHSFNRTATPVSPGVTPPIGLFGLPPEGAAPSLPEHGELVLSFMFGRGDGDPGRFSTHVYADGRLISEQLGDYTADLPAMGLVEQRLTPEGVDLLTAAATSTGVYDHSAHLVGYLGGLSYGELDIRDGDQLVRVSWGSPSDDGLPDEAGTDAQVRVLQQLETQLANPVSWLPASAWVNAAPEPFVPSRYAVCYSTEPAAPLGPVLGSFPQAAEDMLRSWNRTHQVINPRGVTPSESTAVWCSDVTTEQARTLNAIFVDAHFENPNPPYLRYRSELDGRSAHAGYIDFTPQLPDQP